MTYVYTLIYSSYCKDEDDLYSDVIGIYSSKEEATNAMNRDIKICDGEHYDDWEFHEYFADFSNDEFTKHYVITQIVKD